MRLKAKPSRCSDSSLHWAIFQLLVFTTNIGASWAAAAAAVAKTPAISSAGTPYFEYETQQLTDEVIGRLRQDPDAAEYASLFDFDNDSVDPENYDAVLPKQGRCKVFPGDEDWPSDKTWDTFNGLLGNTLIPTTPLAAPCYPSRNEYSAEKCEEVTAKWGDAYFHESDPTSGMWPIWQGRTCLPLSGTTTTTTETCTLGAYPVFAVNVSTVAQVQLAVNFARNAGLRLVIKNTGHCFLGKSSGAGALAVWLHNWRDLEFLPEYGGGPAFKVGPSVTVRQAYEFAHEHDVSVLGGIAESVGFGGGYLQGGGHTPLSGLWGMAADQVLALEVVTADGRFVTASPTSHGDLFWALRGGGGGTFGVVTSTIVRAHPRVPVTTSVFSFETSPNVTADAFFAGLRAYFERFVEFTDAHTYGYFFITPRGNSSYKFEMSPFFAPNHTAASFEALVAPLFATLRGLFGEAFASSIATRHYDAFWPAFRASFVEGPVGSYVMPANRLFPRASWEDPDRFERVWAVLRAHLEQGRNIVGYHQAPRNRAGVDNAVGPAWILIGFSRSQREAVAYLITEVTASADMSPTAVRALARKLDEEIMAPWREVAPASAGGGAYLNEASPMEADWQDDFYGETYGRLLQVKHSVDPRDLFYATTGVGSERWEVRSQESDGVLTQNGRLCRRV
ncbi:hypothetical protein SLS62_007219 [Diatrype stigma]|uniref:FAD-binding PCMH-type domain-containing protein n=1 Tax=Diatrype stigma TaxID=117547 RepID=A0AAN9UR77_9PEZI